MSYSSFHDAEDSCKDYYKCDTQQPERTIESVKYGCLHECVLTVHTGMGTHWYGYTLVWVHTGMGTHIGMGTHWYGYTLVWVHTGMGTHW